MNSDKRLPLFLITGLVLASAGACSDSSRDDGDAAALASGEGLLQYIPADSPYVAAAAEPLPEEVHDALLAKLRPVMDAYGNLLRVAIREGAAARTDEGDQADGQAAEALISEFTHLLTPEGLESAGIDGDSTMALYGHGLWPVLRVSLSDEALMEETLARLEQKIGTTLPTATIDGHRYRIAEGRDGATVVIAVLDGYLVASLVSAEPEEALLRSVLGLDRPARDIAEAGVLTALAEQYGYTPHGLGFLDLERVAAMFLDGQSGLPRAILDEAGIDASRISEVCREETRSLAAVVPRIVTGYTEVSVERMASNSVVELRNDIATGLSGVTAPVPGLGKKGQGGLFAFGMSLDPQAARDFYAARIDALEADPYECEWFADLQASAEGGRAALNQPLPPMVYSFRGFLAVIESMSGMDLEAGQPPTDIEMRLLVATDNAEALIAMGAMFSPEIAALELEPDSKPVRLPVPPAAAAHAEHAYVALSDRALALSVGEGVEARLPAMLAAPPTEPSPFMSLDMDAGAYYGFIGDVVLQADPDDEEEASPALREAVGRTMTSLAETIDRILFDVRFTERGIELPSTVELAD